MGMWTMMSDGVGGGKGKRRVVEGGSLAACGLAVRAAHHKAPQVEGEVMAEPKAIHEFAPGEVQAALEFLKRTRAELRMLRKARLWADRFQVLDINGDRFEIRGVGYPDAGIVTLLRAVNAAFDPETIHRAPPGEYREVDTGRRHTWAEDRVM